MGKKTDRFSNLAALHAEKERLAALRDAHAERLEMHFTALGDGRFRKALVKETLGDAMGHLLPKGLLGTLIGGGGIGGGLSMAMGAKGGWAKRAGLFALGMAAPALVKRMERFSMADVGRELKVSMERWRQHVHDRKEERREEPIDDRS